MAELSFPLRERGLKQCRSIFVTYSFLSFPLRERGLKHQMQTESGGNPNASFPLRERGLKRYSHGYISNPCECRSPCGNVD